MLKKWTFVIYISLYIFFYSVVYHPILVAPAPKSFNSSNERYEQDRAIEGRFLCEKLVKLFKQ